MLKRTRKAIVGSLAVLTLGFGGVAASGGAAFASTCTTSAQFGTCSYSPYVVNQDEWNPTNGSSQTLTASSASNWSVKTNQPGGAYVRTYPDVSQNLSGAPISSFKGIQQNFTDNPAMTSGTWETSTDDWFNGTPGVHTTAATVELMIWTDNHGNHPAGSNVGTATFFGQNFTVYACNGSCVQYSGIGHIYYAFVLQGTETTGTAHVVSALNWLEKNGYISSSLPVNQLDYGMEAGNINSGTNSAGTFSVSAYSNAVQ